MAVSTRDIARDSVSPPLSEPAKSQFSPDADRAHDALGGVVVDADAGISKEELE